MSRIKGLDSLRAIAVLLVIKTHWGPHGFNTFPVLDFIVRYILPSGEFAVDFFFVLSGFLISSILLKSKAEGDNASNLSALQTFVIRRSLRIFPVYFLFLIVLYVIDHPTVRHDIVYYATYTVNYLCFYNASFTPFSHTWTLSVEEQFYLVWPLFILFLPNRYLVAFSLIVIALSSLANSLTQHLYGPFANLLTINCFNAFAIGGLYSITRASKINFSFSKPSMSILVFVAIMLYIAQYFGINILPIRLINSILAISIIMRVTEERYSKAEAFILNSKVLSSLGKVSYGIYLFHYTVPFHYADLLRFFDITNISTTHLLYVPIVAELIQFAMLILISYASFYLFEMQFLRFKGLFKYQLKLTTTLKD